MIALAVTPNEVKAVGFCDGKPTAFLFREMNMNDIAVARSEKTVTTKELAEQLKTSPKVILENAKKCLPNKQIANGKATFWNKAEVTVLIDCLKNNPQTNSKDLYLKSKGEISTDLTPALKIKKAMELMQEGYEEELSILRLKNAELQPKAEVYDSISDSATLQDLQTVSVTIGLKNIFKILEADGIIEPKITQDNQKYYKPLAKYTDYLVLKEGKAWTDPQGIKHIRPRVFVTGKGLLWLSKKYGTKADV